MALDLDNGYKEIKDKIGSAKAYTDLKSQYSDLKKKAGDSFETNQAMAQEGLDNFKKTAEDKLNEFTGVVNKHKKNVKTQFEHLIDIKRILSGKGGNSIRYIKRMLIKVLAKIEPKIGDILFGEVLAMLGCDQQQAYSAGPQGQVLYIKTKSIDLGRLLTKDPQGKKNKSLYEKQSLSGSQTYPFPMNKELYNRIQEENDSYQNQYGNVYYGRSGKPLFDIQYTDTNDLGETGSFYKVTLLERITLTKMNNISEFIKDYFKTIKIFDFTSVLAWVLECMLGAISISGGIGLKKVDDVSKVMAVIQRLLGICFDNRKTIDVSGISKLSEIDEDDNSYYELSEIDLRNIEERQNNIKNKVVKFLSCNDVALPVNTDGIIDELDNILFIEDEDKQIDAAINLTDNLTNDPDWNGFALDGSLKAELDFDFVKNLAKGLAISLFSPKILLPIAIMLKALGKSILDAIESFYDFIRQFSRFFKNVVSKIMAIFIQTLFNEIKKDIRGLVQQVILDLAKEKAAKQVTLILKLVQLLITVANFIRDFRECKSVIDEILWLLKIVSTGWGGVGKNPLQSSSNIPLPLLFASQLLDGYSQTRSFINTISELQKIGIPTGPMPDGSPNLTVLSLYSMLQGQSYEMLNSKIQVAVPALAVLPTGLTVPGQAFGVLT